MNHWMTLTQPLVHRLGWTLVHSTWEGLLIAALLAIVLRLLRSASANARYAACGLALALTIAAAGATFTIIAERAAPANFSNTIAPRASVAPIAPPSATMTVVQ